MPGTMMKRPMFKKGSKPKKKKYPISILSFMLIGLNKKRVSSKNETLFLFTKD